MSLHVRRWIFGLVATFVQPGLLKTERRDSLLVGTPRHGTAPASRALGKIQFIFRFRDTIVGVVNRDPGGNLDPGAATYGVSERIGQISALNARRRTLADGQARPGHLPPCAVESLVKDSHEARAALLRASHITLGPNAKKLQNGLLRVLILPKFQKVLEAHDR